ncbi:MAG: type II toxin-antitoxin system MqsR family toxin [Sneathiellaceae bacterium]
MEKRTPHHDLEAFQRYWLRWCMVPNRPKLATTTAIHSAVILGFDIASWTRCILSMKHRHFYKSMTSNHDHRRWQDVYHVPFEGMTYYVKFTDTGLRAFRLLSFKELDDDRPWT